MAPKRKNKKIASNPARGFATTSIASKVNNASEEIIEKTTLSEGVELQTNPQAVCGDQPPAEQKIHELSPEALEKHLEESELQLFVEKHIGKIRRDASRQVAKLQTDRRLLRVQAEPLSTPSWLPPEVMELIMQTLDAEKTFDRPGNGMQNEDNRVEMSEDDVCIRIWTLKQALIQLGFAHDSCQGALRNLLMVWQRPSVRDSLVIKDSIWGLDHCLDWLALHCEAQAVPPYDSIHRVPKVTPLLEQHLQNNASNASAGNENLRTPIESRSASPRSQNRTVENDGQSLEDAATTTVDDTESETDPETMTETYIALQTRLYELQPDLQDTNKHCKVPSRHGPAKALNPLVTRLLQRLERLKADVLFDRHEAEHRWSETRNGLLQAAAERRKLHLNSESRPVPDRPDGQNTAGRTKVQADVISNGSGENSDLEALGEFFSGLPDTTTSDDSDRIESDTNADDPHHRRIIIRDFGKWSGVSPRRTFEEACKARDSSSRIIFQLIDRSPFSKQHSINIRWSCTQPQPLDSPTEAILCESDQRIVRIQMLTEAVPDAAQSEAYVATAALFLIFSGVPKEEKASLRLPPAWKDFWFELSSLKKSNDMAADREELREIRTLVDGCHWKDETLGQDPGIVKSRTTPVKLDDVSAQEKEMAGLEMSEHGDYVKSMWSAKSDTPSFRSILRQRESLPIWDFKNNILQTIQGHQIVIVCGETGCGKSTQVPSFILEHELSSGRGCKIYCTEPRRISAISLARRVSEELGERKSDVGTSRSLVGYAIRLESKMVRETKLVYATTGIVMRMLEASDNLQEITHLILDEVHERSIESDFLLIVLRKLLIRRPALKVILMSATVDAAKFSSYFNGAPVLTVPGRTFPVQVQYLEDAIEETNFSNRDFLNGVPSIDDDDEVQESSLPADKKEAATGLDGYSQKTRSTLAKLDEYRINYDLMVSLLETIATKPKFSKFNKAILVFLPGIAEIRRLNDMLSGHAVFIHGWNIHPLHSTIAMDEQERAFVIPPLGQRKIVLATNIAETGVTIPDVTCVIDAGKHKEMRFDERRQLSRLIEVFISCANAKQRRGRAGRVQEGICFHLFTKSRHDDIMARDQTPEILRLSLQDLVLRVKICKLGSIEQTLAEALDPPLAKNIRRAIDALVDVKALTVSEELTPLGRQLAKLPLDVFLGKLILLGCIFKCLDGALTIAAILSSKSPFSAPMGARSQADQARLAFKRGDSDLLTVYNAYCAWRRVCNTSGASEQQFYRKNFLLHQNLTNIEELKGQLTTCLVEAGFIELQPGEKASLNRPRLRRLLLIQGSVRSWSTRKAFVEIPVRYGGIDSSDLVLNSIVGWSFFPKLLKRDGKGWRNIANNQSVSLSPTSVNKGAERPPNWLSFYHIMQSSNKFYNAHETSAMEPFALTLACGDAEFKMYSGIIVIDGNRIRFSVDDWKVMLAIKTLRYKLRQITAQSFRDPGHQLSAHQQVWFDIWEKIYQHQAESQARNTARMARSLPSQPLGRLTRVSSLSPIEELVQSKERPTSMIIQIFHPRYLDCYPADHLMSLLPRSSALTLRAVSHTMKTWAHDHRPDLLTSLRVTCPLPRSSKYSGDSVLRNLADRCLQLSIRVLPSATAIPADSPREPSPAAQIFHLFRSFKSLRIEAPLTDAFHPLLSLRLALESASLKTVTEIHIERLPIPGLLALRWGGFDAFKESTWTGETFWRRLTSMRIGMKSDWLRPAHPDRDSNARNGEALAKTKEERDIYRQSIQIIHDWFFQFSLNGNLQRLCFEWVDGTGPNPLLLDEEVAKEGGGRWFSAPGIKWKGVEEVWLGGVSIEVSDVIVLKKWFPGLEKLLVWDEFADSSIFGRVMMIRGREWLDVELLPSVQRPSELVGVEEMDALQPVRKWIMAAENGDALEKSGVDHQGLGSALLSSSTKCRLEELSRLEKSLADASLPEPSALHLIPSLFRTYPFYRDRPSRKAVQDCLRSLLTNGKYSDALPLVLAAFEEETSKTGLAASNAFVLVEWGSVIVTQCAIGEEAWKSHGMKVVNQHASILETCMAAQGKSGVKNSALVGTRRAYRDLFHGEKGEQRVGQIITQLTATTSPIGAQGAVLLGVVAGVCARRPHLKPVLEAQKGHYISFFLREIVGSRTTVPKHIVNALGDFFSTYINSEDLEKDIGSAFEKALLRAPEVVLNDLLSPMIATLPRSVDVAPLLSTRLAKPLLSNVKSSNAKVRDGAVLTFTDAVNHSKDEACLLKVADEVLSPLSSSKLTAADHRALHSRILANLPRLSGRSEAICKVLAAVAVKETNEAALNAELQALSHHLSLLIQTESPPDESIKACTESVCKGLSDKKPTHRRAWVLMTGDVLWQTRKYGDTPGVRLFIEATIPKTLELFPEITSNVLVATQSGLVVAGFILTALYTYILDVVASSKIQTSIRKASIFEQACPLNPKISFLISHRVYSKLVALEDLR
ncbi:MAG: hypothetical protein Q9224_001329, partial [Gallowayella concinna]